MTRGRDEQIGFLGGGHMGRALVMALLRQGVAPACVTVGEADADRRRSLTDELGIHAVADNLVVAERAEILLLAVKPQDMTAALRPLQAVLARRRPLLISIAAGLTIARLRDALGAASGVALVRAMPNRPAMLGVGATGLHAPPEVSAADRTRAAAVLGAAGLVAWIEDESLMDVVTAVCGSGPAYFFRLAEALAEAGRAHGLPDDIAHRLAAATLAGAGAMAAADPRLAALRESVTSRGGTTAAALAQFETDGLSQSVARAVDAAVTRGRELAAASPGA